MATSPVPMDWTAYYNSIKAQNPSASTATRAAAQTALGGTAPTNGYTTWAPGTSAYMGSVMAGNSPQDPASAAATAQELTQGRPIGNGAYAPVTAPTGWNPQTGQYTAPVPPPPAPPPTVPPTSGGSALPSTGDTTQVIPRPGSSAGDGTSSGYGPFPPASGAGSGGSTGPYPSGAPAPTQPGTPAPVGALPQYATPGGGASVSGYPSIPGSTSFNTPGPYTTPNQILFKSGPQLAPEIESDRQLAIAGGQQLQNQFRQNAGTAAQQANYFQGQLANAYAPLLAGQGGYTPAQIAAIQANTGQFGLSSLDPNAYLSNLQGGAANLNAAVGGEAGAVNQALTQGSTAVNAAINPAELKWTPEMTQALKNAAAQTSAAQTDATVQDIQNRAFAAGNVSPQAIAAMQDRARLTGQINAAQAMTQAQLGANQAQLGAAQTYANLAAQNAQETAQRNAGAQLQLGAQNVGAQQYLTGAGQGAVGAQQNELMNANQLESGRATTTANANLQAGQEARNNYLGTQAQQASQNMQVAGQQQLGTYSSQTGGVNQANQVGVGNKAVNQQNPGTVTNILGFAKGALLKGPRTALVGERGPEAIVPLGPPKGAPQPHLMHMPRFQTAKNPNYGISPASLGRTMTRSGFQRILPQFVEGGEIVPMQYGDIINDDTTYAGTSPDPSILNPGYTSQTDPGLTDKTTGYGPNPWQRAAAIAGALAAGRMLPGLAGKLGDYGMSSDPNASLSGRDLAGAAVGDVAGRRNPMAGRLAQEAISKPVTPPPNPAGEAGAAAEKTTYANIMHNPTPPEPKGDIILGGGGGSSKKSIPLPRTGSAKTEPPVQTKPTPTLTGSQTHDAPPGVVGGPPSGPSNVSLPPGPYYNPNPVPPPPVVPPGKVDSSIKFGGQVPDPFGSVPIQYDPFPGQTGPESPMPGELPQDPGLTGTSDQNIDFGQGPIDPGTGQSVDPTVGSPISESPAPDPGTLNPGFGNYGDPIYGGTPGGGGAEIPPGGYTGPGGFGGDYGGGGGGSGVDPHEEFIATARGGLFAPAKPSRSGRTPQGMRHKVSTGRPKKGDTSPSAAAKSAVMPPPMMPEMAPPASPVSMMVPPVGDQQPQGYANGGIFKPFPGYATGGVVSPEEQQLLQSPYGPTEFVDGPQIRTLGQSQPQAVVPLTPRKANKVRPEMIPHLIQQYGLAQAQR